MEEVCAVVRSQKGNEKISIRGYLMVRERRRKNAVYWCCQSRKLLDCKGRAVTEVSNEEHHLKKFVQHNHAPVASDSGVAKAVWSLKDRAKETNEFPCKIVQETFVTIPENVEPYMPSRDALRQTIKRIRKGKGPAEPRTLDEIDIPIRLQKFNGEQFLVRSVSDGEEKILLFTTALNVQRLSLARYWIMDGTFKTVPSLFYQLYTVHAPVGYENSRILPLIFALMTKKSEENYKILFQNVTDFAEENDIILKPETIITDLELAAINASKSEFPDVRNKVCLFHLGQCIWRQIRSNGLATKYGTDENFSLMMRHLIALAFVPSDEIPEAFYILKQHLPVEAANVADWFESYYISGKVKRHLRNGTEVRTPPPFTPKMWSVYDSVEENIPRTQNNIEAWHRRWENIIGRAHPGLHYIIEEFQKEQRRVEHEAECIIRGEPIPKKKKATAVREERIIRVVKEYRNVNIMDYLRGIAHNIRV